MKIFLVIILLVSQFLVAQQKSVFDLARSGTVAEMKELLVKNPSLVNSINEQGYSPLILATYRENNLVARYLIENGANVNGTSSMGTPLMAAVVKGNGEIAKLLINKNADVNIFDSSGNTALIYSVIFKRYEILEELIKVKIDKHYKDIRGKSALDYAVINNDEKAIQILKDK